MTELQSISRIRTARTARAFAVVCVAAAYLLSGLLHNLCDIDVAPVGGNAQIASVAHDGAQHHDGVALAGHHCHGCFSVSVPAAPAPAPTAMTSNDVVRGTAAAVLIDRADGLDPPPPKPLT